jgi:hypothetical protein
MAQLAITFRDRVLDWYMSLDVNSKKGAGEPKTVAEVKKMSINEFQKPISQD